MFLSTIANVVGIAGGVKALTSGGSSSSGGSGALYVPQDLPGTDQSWQDIFQQSRGLSNQAYDQTNPMYLQALQQMQGVNYDPLLQAGNQSGVMSGQGAGMLMQNAQGMQGAGQNILNTAFDPQNALYGRTQQQLQDQVRMGQAARGLGNSAVGGAEENQAMNNFNIDWQNQQLARQQQGIQGATAANSSMGANLSAAPGMQLDAGQTPAMVQQTVAQQPGLNAAQFQQWLAQLQGMYGQNLNNASQYMGLGSTAQNNAAQYYSGQNSQAMQGLTNGLNGLASNPTVQGWFGGNPTGVYTGTGGAGYGTIGGDQGAMLNAQW